MDKNKLAAWRAGREFQTALPSGLPVRLRRVSIQDLLLAGGDVAALLFGMVGDEAGPQELDMGDLVWRLAESDMLPRLVNPLVRAALVWPPVTEDGGDDSITLEELPMSDRLYIFNLLNQDAAAVRPFRPESDEPGLAVGAAPPRQRVPRATKRHHGD